MIAARWRDWVKARFSVTLGRAIVFTPRAWDSTIAVDNPIECHEHVHVRQMEDECLKATLAALAVLLSGHWVIALCVWISGGAWMFVHYLAALIRYGFGGIYLDSENERSAYAQTDLDHPSGLSWLERQTLRRRK